LDREVAERLRPFEEDLELLETIPGVGRRSAECILAEIGTDMNRFPSDAHLASWAGMSPGNNESAGKRKSGKTRKGNKNCEVRWSNVHMQLLEAKKHTLHHNTAALLREGEAIVPLSP